MNMIKAYGDTLDDGAVQISFTLPVKFCDKTLEAGRVYLKKMGFEGDIVHHEKVAENFTFFTAYGKTSVSIDYDAVHVDNEGEIIMDMNEIDEFIKEKIKRKVVIVGACTGTDAHTVGIDAIMNMKGCNHRYGLERYSMIDAYNLGASVPNEQIINFAKKVKADAILVSQIVTQKDVHVLNLTNFVELLEAEGVKDQFIICVGGPRITNALAVEIGFDRGFGRGSYANNVGTFIVETMYQEKFKV